VAPADAADDTRPPEAPPALEPADRREDGKKKDGDELSDEEKRLKKQRKLAEDSHRPLDAWERYRALSDAFDNEQELVDLADHKARFALMIMGALNAVTFLLGAQPAVIASLPQGVRPWLMGFVGIYAVVAVYFFLQAIEALRPRAPRPNIADPSDGSREDRSLGLRFYADILTRDEDAYRSAWREVRIGQLNAEVATQTHILARINRAKYRALSRLYVGLQIMTVLTAVLIGTIAMSMYLQERVPTGAGEAPPSLVVPGVPR
jgi:hypothetical protein